MRRIWLYKRVVGGEYITLRRTWPRADPSFKTWKRIESSKTSGQQRKASRAAALQSAVLAIGRRIAAQSGSGFYDLHSPNGRPYRTFSPSLYMYLIAGL
jgi:hypothetical protein